MRLWLALSMLPALVLAQRPCEIELQHGFLSAGQSALLSAPPECAYLVLRAASLRVDAELVGAAGEILGHGTPLHVCRGGGVRVVLRARYGAGEYQAGWTEDRACVPAMPARTQAGDPGPAPAPAIDIAHALGALEPFARGQTHLRALLDRGCYRAVAAHAAGPILEVRAAGHVLGRDSSARPMASTTFCLDGPTRIDVNAREGAELALVHTAPRDLVGAGRAGSEWLPVLLRVEAGRCYEILAGASEGRRGNVELAGPSARAVGTPARLWYCAESDGQVSLRARPLRGRGDVWVRAGAASR